jgi:alkanesulfonate monooxygenase SsuD/methylene tetrahydromethanopterin reductase-like flavin-dependent oxidoreductase (luciferase family)
MLPPEQALRDYSVSEQMALAEMKDKAFVGTAAVVADKLNQLAERLHIQEVVVITWTHDPQAQRRSYELLAQEFALAPQP